MVMFVTRLYKSGPAIFKLRLALLSVILRSLRSRNALPSIEVTLSGIVILVRLEQSMNALLPIEVTGLPLKILVMTKDPLLVERQSDTIYPLLLPFKVRVIGVDTAIGVPLRLPLHRCNSNRSKSNRVT